MKRYFRILTIFLCLSVLIGTFAACNTAPEPSETSGEAETSFEKEETTTPGTIPPQPLRFSTFNRMLAFLIAPAGKIEGKPEDHQKAYMEMVETFRSSEWLYSASKVSGESSDVFTLYPRVKYEDIGIGYRFIYNDKSVRVIFCKRAELPNTTQPTDMQSYMDERFAFTRTPTTIGNVNDLFLGEALLMEGESWNSIWGLIDETYYMVVQADLPPEDIEAFLSTIKIEKISSDAIK